MCFHLCIRRKGDGNKVDLRDIARTTIQSGIQSESLGPDENKHEFFCSDISLNTCVL